MGCMQSYVQVPERLCSARLKEQGTLNVPPVIELEEYDKSISNRQNSNNIKSYRRSINYDYYYDYYYYDYYYNYY